MFQPPSPSDVPWRVEAIFQDHPDWRQAVHEVMGAKPLPGRHWEKQTLRFVNTLRRRGLKVGPALAIHDRRGFRSALLMVESPGSVAMLLTPAPESLLKVESALPAALSAAQEHVAAQEIALLQTLIGIDDAVLPPVLNRGGFRYLTQLIYLQRDVPQTVAPPLPDWEWISYTPETHALFIEALKQSYVDSLDCPGLAGVRSHEDLLRGHRVCGDSQTALWRVAARRGHPQGILLPSRHDAPGFVEIVYMGVGDAHRRQGVGGALLSRAAGETVAEGLRTLFLAVDRANEAARGLYEHWGFYEVGRRDAWIFTPFAAPPPVASRES